MGGSRQLSKIERDREPPGDSILGEEGSVSLRVHERRGHRPTPPASQISEIGVQEKPVWRCPGSRDCTASLGQRLRGGIQKGEEIRELFRPLESKRVSTSKHY